MSAKSQRLLREQDRFIRDNGEDVLFKGGSYRCFVQEISGAHAGEQALSHTAYGIYIASSVPSRFDFAPKDFFPFTSVQPPMETDELTRNKLIYVVTAVNYDNEDDDTVIFWCYALRKIWETP